MVLNPLFSTVLSFKPLSLSISTVIC